MPDYIDREAAIDATYALHFKDLIQEALRNLPAADVRPVVRGHNTGNARIFSCSECGYGIEDIFLSNEEDYSAHPNFCPNCGAMMEEDKDG